MRIVPWNESQFLAAEDAWDALLRESDAHPLFMGWRWLRYWWETMARSTGAELLVLAAYDDGERLTAIAPLLFRRETIRGMVPVKRLSLMASSWGRTIPLRTEYQSFVMRRGVESNATRSILQAIGELPHWDEFVLGDVEVGTPFHVALMKYGPELGYLRVPIPGPDYAYKVETSGSFQGYKAGLSGSTRRRLFNLRARLEREHGPVKIEYADESAVEHYLDDLNRLHTQRWNRPVFQGPQWDFNVVMARHLARKGELKLSRLVAQGRVISVLYNFLTGDSEVNFQAGFDAGFDKHIPLGYLHLGYAIEACFQSEVNELDCLAGWGKGSNYKAQFSTHRRELTVVQIARNRLFAVAYRLRDQSRRRKRPV